MYDPKTNPAEAVEAKEVAFMTPYDTRSQNGSGEEVDLTPSLSPREIGEAALRTLKDEFTPSYNTLHDLLQGGTGRYDELLMDGDGRTIRHRQELLTLTLLYQTIRFVGHQPHGYALSAAMATFKDYVEANPETEDYQPRRWLKNDGAYKRNRMNQFWQACDRGAFQRFLNQTAEVEEDWQGWTGEYSNTTKGFVKLALNILTGVLQGDTDDVDELRETVAMFYSVDVDPDRLEAALQYSTPSPSVSSTYPPSGRSCTANRAYPTRAEVVEVAQLLHPDRAERSHETVLKELQREHGEVKMAYCPSYPNGEEHVYYPYLQPDPTDAQEVWLNGEKREPESTQGGDEVRVMTDGGTEQHGENESDADFTTDTDERMSTTADTTGTSTGRDEYSEAELRARFPEIVLSTSGKCTNKLHPPDGDGVEPLCGSAVSRDWRRKSVAVYPPGFKEWCGRCIERLREQEPEWSCPACEKGYDGKHGLATHVGRAHPEERPRDVVDTVRYRDAMTAEWA